MAFPDESAPYAIEQRCRFCAIGRGKTKYSDVDLPIADFGDHYSLASIGAFIEGWTLLIPREHCISLRTRYSSPVFITRLREVVAHVRHRYGRVVVFEHGPNEVGSATSCGTDHAHMHVVPFSTSLLDLARESNLRSWEPVKACELADKVGSSEYLFFAEEFSKDLAGYCHVLDEPVSQFFRKLIASKLGLLGEADYKTHLHIRTAKKTRAVLSTLS